MYTVLSVVQVFIAVGLIFLILLHSGKDAGMSGAFGVGTGGGSSAGGSLDGAQPRPLDDHLRGPVRPQHVRAAEALALQHRAVLDLQRVGALLADLDGAAGDDVAAEATSPSTTKRSAPTSDGGPSGKRPSKSRRRLKNFGSSSTKGDPPLSRSGATTSWKSSVST